MNARRPLKQLLATGDSTLQQLIAQAKHFETLGAQLGACLPAEQVSAVSIVGFGNSILTLATRSNAWATRLRYQAPQLVRCLQQLPAFRSIARIDIRVIPPTVEPNPPSDPAHLSKESAEIIRNAADTLASPALGAALRRLARHGK